VNKIHTFAAIAFAVFCPRPPFAGLDLAQACRKHCPSWSVLPLWVLAEIAIAATDLAEVLGCAVALQMLFGLKLVWGILITAADVMLIMFFERRHIRYVEALVSLLTLGIAACLFVDLALAKPDLAALFKGFIPRFDIVFTDSNALYISIGILGATVMPHNLFIHGAMIKTRQIEDTLAAKSSALYFSTIDSTASLAFAFLINGSILCLAAAAFYSRDVKVDDIREMPNLLAPVLGATAGGVLFAVSLLFSGQNASFTGTLSGQVVMDGFLRINLPPWLRRLLTRALAIVPAAIVAGVLGDTHAVGLLVLSQVTLSLQLPFAVLPLVYFTSSSDIMGEFVNSTFVKLLGIFIGFLICGLNFYLVVQFFAGL
jgi:manganese transport protein